MKVYRFVILTLFFHIHVTAQTCCSGGVPLSNNIGLPILNKGDFQFGLYYDYNNLNTLKEGERTLNDNSRLRITHAVLLNFAYNITHNLAVEGLFTWVNQQRIITQFGTSNLDQTFGLGDAIVLGRYRFLNKVSYEASVGIGGKLPIGPSTRTNDLGILLNADLQPGNNAFDLIFLSSFAKRFEFRKSMNLSLRFTYRNTGTNTTYQRVNRYRFGNEFQTFVTLSDQFLLFNQLINPSLSFKYRHAAQDQINANEIANTGGQWGFLIPSFSLAITPKFNFATRVEIPVYSNLQGTQLTPTYRLNVGFSYLFSKPKTINLNRKL